MSVIKKMLGEQDKVDLTPMIDVTFLLLIYFMVSTMLKQPEAELAIRLPGKALNSSKLRVMPRYDVLVKETGEVHLNKLWIGDTESDQGMVALIQSLADELKNRNRIIASKEKSKEEAQLIVQIKSERACEHQATMTVLNACAEAGVKKITFVVY